MTDRMGLVARTLGELVTVPGLKRNHELGQLAADLQVGSGVSAARDWGAFCWRGARGRGLAQVVAVSPSSCQGLRFPTSNSDVTALQLRKLAGEVDARVMQRSWIVPSS